MQVEIYSALSKIYDHFMRSIPYKGWAAFIRDKLVSEGISEGLVLDLGCGSGTLTMLLSDMGYDMIGIDGSWGMLNLALEKRGERNILYLNQDIREFELYGTVKAVTASCDTFNYITSAEDLAGIFKLVKNYLEPGGVFVFDLHTRFYYENVLSDNVFAQTEEEGAYIWENSFDPDEGLNSYSVTMFIKDDTGEGDGDDMYKKYEELHLEKAYEVVDIKQMLKEAGLKLVNVFDGYRDEPLKEDSDRAVFIAAR